jgi:uncharacterized protein (TIGR03435 family)
MFFAMQSSADFSSTYVGWHPATKGTPNSFRQTPRAIVQPDGPSLFTLIQEQLGLKLVATKDMIPVLVVDHAEEPSPN